MLSLESYFAIKILMQISKLRNAVSRIPWSVIVALFVLISLLGCAETDMIDPVIEAPDEQGRISCQIDGQAFASNFPLVSGVLSTSSGIYTLSFGGIDFFGADTISLLISINGKGFSEVMPNDEFRGTNMLGESLAIGAVSIDHKPQVEDDATSLETDDAYVKITAINHTDQLASGIFAFVAEDPDNGKRFVVSDGTFTDVHFQ